MILFSFFGSLMLAAIVAYLFEKWGWTHNGIIPSVLIAFGAVLILYFLRALFGFSLGSPGVTAIVGSAAALIPEDGMVAALPRRHRNVPRWWCSKPRKRRGRQNERYDNRGRSGKACFPASRGHDGWGCEVP